ncbi:MAG: methyltransferase domain-containing protein [Chitinophagaceae bacterium]|nr:methyltransferase domain-containing protein [Rubrivivax sp.]
MEPQIKANAPELGEAELLRRIASVRHWYHQIEIRPGLVTPGINHTANVLPLLALPADCTGLRVLDIGARDGYFSFEAERRGAEVLAVDYLPDTETGFRVAAGMLGSRVEFRRANIYDLHSDDIGSFDIVLCLGLLYHLPDPMQALGILRKLCRDLLCLETYVIDNELRMPDGSFRTMAEVAPVLTSLPLMQFYAGDALNGDPTNYWGQNVECLKQMLAESNFTLRNHVLNHNRVVMNCHINNDTQLDYFNRLARGRHGK